MRLIDITIGTEYALKQIFQEFTDDLANLSVLLHVHIEDKQTGQSLRASHRHSSPTPSNDSILSRSNENRNSTGFISEKSVTDISVSSICSRII